MKKFYVYRVCSALATLVALVVVTGASHKF